MKPVLLTLKYPKACWASIFLSFYTIFATYWALIYIILFSSMARSSTVPSVIIRSFEVYFFLIGFGFLFIFTPSCMAMSCFAKKRKRLYSIQSFPCYIKRVKKDEIAYRYHIDNFFHLSFGDLIHIRFAYLLEDVSFKLHSGHPALGLRVHPQEFSAEKVYEYGVNHIHISAAWAGRLPLILSYTSD